MNYRQKRLSIRVSTRIIDPPFRTVAFGRPGQPIIVMNATHVHLMLNHFSVVGAFFGFFLLAAGILGKSEELKRTSLILFMAGALMALPVYLTGRPAEKSVQSLPGVNTAAIEKHKLAAQLALSTVLVLGGLSASTFWLFRKNAAMPFWFAMLLLVAALVVSGLMAWTAAAGGQIRHPEISIVSSG